MRNFIRTIVGCSEKAANIARACRKEKDLFQLLVEVKMLTLKHLYCKILREFRAQTLRFLIDQLLSGSYYESSYRLWVHSIDILVDS